MKLTKSHLRKIIQEELRELKNISDPVRAVGGAGRPRLAEWAYKLMNELTPEIPALQLLSEKKFDSAVKRIADGMWEGLMGALDLAPEPQMEELSPGEQGIAAAKQDAYRQKTDYPSEDAAERIEKELNALWDDGATNEELISILEKMIGHIRSGFIGEPT